MRPSSSRSRLRSGHWPTSTRAVLLAATLLWRAQLAVAAPSSATTAAAKAEPSAAVLAVSTSGALTAAQRAALRRDLRASGAPARALRVLDARQLWARIDRLERRVALVRGRELAREGWLLAGHVRLDEAVKALRAALARFSFAQPLGPACDGAAAVLRDLAFVRWQQQRKGAAARLLASAARLRPASGGLDRTRFPPTFRRYAAKLPRSTPQATLVQGRQGAMLTASCRVVGPLPQQLAGAGWSLVRVDAPGREPWARAMRLHGRNAASLPVGRARAPLTQAAGVPALSTLRRRARASGIVVVFRADRALRWRALLSGSTSIATGRIALGSAAIAGASSPAGSTRRRTAVVVARWTSSALAVAALAAGATFALLARGAASDLEDAAASGARFDDQLARSEDRLDAMAPAAYALLGVGAASAVTALVLWLWVDARAPAISARASARSGAASLSWRW